MYTLCKSFLVKEAKEGQPKMMTVGLHCRLARPARAAALADFLHYAKSFGRDVWICTREQIANHWYENHLPRGAGSPIQPAALSTPSAASSSTSRFSFLGNLTTPRGEAPADAPAPAEVPTSSEDGDII